MTLEMQYKIFLQEHPDCNYSYDEWMDVIMKPLAENIIKQIQKAIEEDF